METTNQPGKIMYALKMVAAIAATMVVLTLLLVFGIPSVRAPTINGVVKINNQPVEGVKVRVKAAYAYPWRNETTVSDSLGRFHTDTLKGTRPLLDSTFSYTVSFEHKGNISYWSVEGDGGGLMDSEEKISCSLDLYDASSPYNTCLSEEPYASLEDVLAAMSDMLPAEKQGSKAQIDSVSYSGDSMLHVALWRKDLRALKILIDAGAGVNAVGEMGETPLHAAIALQSVPAIKMLLAAGARTDIRSKFDETAAEKAEKLGGEIAELLKVAKSGQ